MKNPSKHLTWFIIILMFAMISVAATRTVAPINDDEGWVGRLNQAWHAIAAHALYMIDAIYNADRTCWIGHYDSILRFYDNDGNYTLAQLASGGDSGTSTAAKIVLPAGSWDYFPTNPAPLNTDTGGTTKAIKEHLFDDTTNESIGVQVALGDIAAAGTVTFHFWGSGATAGALATAWSLYHRAVADSESWDGAFVEEYSGDKTTDAVQDDIDYFTWTETIANLGWSDYDFLLLELMRAATNDAFSGDYGFKCFMIELP